MKLLFRSWTIFRSCILSQILETWIILIKKKTGSCFKDTKGIACQVFAAVSKQAYNYLNILLCAFCEEGSEEKYIHLNRDVLPKLQKKKKNAP